MAILMLINAETAHDNVQNLNDIVGVFPDSHVFSSTELVKFDFLTINGSVEDVRLILEQITPTTARAYKWQSDNQYHWTSPDGETVIDEIYVYQIEGDKKWYHMVNDFKFPCNVGELTSQEKQLLETIDINHPSVDSFVRKLVKDITEDIENNTEINELRDSNP